MQEAGTTISRRALAAILCIVAGCAADPGGGGDPGGGPIDQPDAAPAHPARNRCQAGDPPCESGTECVDFGNYGGQVCAQYCTQSSDCDTGLVCVPDQSGKGVCATSEWGGPAGITPEVLCSDEAVCNREWGSNQNGCTAYFDACLSGLNDSQLQQWTSYVDSCLDNANSSCDTAFNCLTSRPWC